MNTTPMSHNRPLRWEDDFSLKALDTKPFENSILLSDWSDEERKRVSSGYNLSVLAEYKIADAIKRDTLAVPSDDDREAYSQGFDGYYWLSGLRDFHVAQQTFERWNCKPDRILEMGCATGRVMRHFVCQTDMSEIWGMDINHRHVRWLLEHMPERVKPVTLPALPALPMEDNYFHAVLAYSVFTHIDTFETGFLAELRRILEPGGIAILTAHTESTWEQVQSGTGPAVESFLARLRASIPQLEDLLKHDLPKGRTGFRHTNLGPYRGQVWHSTDYIKRVWGRFFEILEIVPLAHNLQTVIILRKPKR
jgi:ubiquinone/menaquinone biosynthesis C-methylase UbiE